MSQIQTSSTLSTPVNGVLLMLGFAAFAPIIDIFAKLAGTEVPVGQITLARFTVQTAILFPIAYMLGTLHWPDRREIGLHLLRGLLIVLATTAFFYALKFMAVAEAISIFFVEPLIVTLLGSLFLGEIVGWRRVVAAFVGFGGALIVIRPSFVEFGWVALVPLITAFFFALYLLLTRTMAQRMNPLTLQTYTSLAGLVIVAPVLWLFDGTGHILLDPVWPEPVFWVYLVCTGIAATFAHLLLSFAFKFAPASTLAPLQYMEIVSATFLGFLVFSDLPDAMTFLGIAIIIASGIYIFWRERSLSRELASEVPAETI